MFNSYNVIYHQDRNRLQLSILEYCVCDTVYHLSGNPKYNRCIMSRESMANFFGVSKRGIINTIDKLVKLGFIEKDDTTKSLKTSQLWYDEIIVNNGGAKIAPVVQNWPEKPVQKLHWTGAKIAPYIDIISSLIFIDDTVKKSFTDYIIYRVQKKWKLSELTISLSLKKLNKLSQRPEDQVKILEQSIERGRDWLFEIKKSRANNKPQASNGVYEDKEYKFE